MEPENKANSVLRFTGRTKGPRNPKLFSKLYMSLVRPILQYCSPVWSPHLKKDSAILEKVRRRTPRYAIRNIARDMSYEERLKVLKWPTLHQRRLFSSLTECYKTANSLNGLHPFEYFAFAHDFRPLRTNHRHKLKPLPAKLNSFKYSFCASIVNKWNNLPKIVAEAETLNIFKSRVRRHFTNFLGNFELFSCNF